MEQPQNGYLLRFLLALWEISNCSSVKQIMTAHIVEHII